MTFTAVDVPGALLTAVSGIDTDGVIAGSYRDSTTVHGFLAFGTMFQRVDLEFVPYTRVRGINGARLVGGYADAVDDGAGCENPGTPGCHGFVITSEENMFDAPGAVSTLANGLGGPGLRIVGMYADGSGGVHGFQFVSGVFTTIDPPGAVLSFANGVTLSAKVVGGPLGR
jgi:hypothetical protein